VINHNVIGGNTASKTDRPERTLACTALGQSSMTWLASPPPMAQRLYLSAIWSYLSPVSSVRFPSSLLCASWIHRWGDDDGEVRMTTRFVCFELSLP